MVNVLKVLLLVVPVSFSGLLSADGLTWKSNPEVPVALLHGSPENSVQAVPARTVMWSLIISKSED